MHNQETYKRFKIKWWLIQILAGILAFVFLLFLLMTLGGNKPLDKTGFVISITIIAVLYGICICLGGWSKLIINDCFAIFRFDLLTVVKIPIASIRDISTERVAKLDFLFFPKKDFVKCFFDFVKQAVRIEMKSGKIYQITIKNAQEIKEEIEKRMLITNNIPSIA